MRAFVCFGTSVVIVDLLKLLSSNFKMRYINLHVHQSCIVYFDVVLVVARVPDAGQNSTHVIVGLEYEYTSIVSLTSPPTYNALYMYHCMFLEEPN